MDRKYGVVICKFTSELTHPLREEESSLGNLLADAMAESLGLDVMLLGAGAVRVKSLGPTVTLMDFMGCFPYDDAVVRFTVTGKTLKTMFARWMRTENRLSGEGECYQVNGAVRARYNDAEERLVSLELNGGPVADDALYTVGLQAYHVANSTEYLGVTADELAAAGPSKVVSTSGKQVLEEWLRTHPNVGRAVEGRLVYE